MGSCVCPRTQGIVCAGGGPAEGSGFPSSSSLSYFICDCTGPHPQRVPRAVACCSPTSVARGAVGGAACPKAGSGVNKGRGWRLEWDSWGAGLGVLSPSRWSHCTKCVCPHLQPLSLGASCVLGVPLKHRFPHVGPPGLSPGGEKQGPPHFPCWFCVFCYLL